MASAEKVERIGGFTLLGIPVFDASVFALDNYARLELLVRLHSVLPAFLSNPLFVLLCVLLALFLLERSHKHQLERLANSSGLVGVESYRQDKRSSLLWSFLWVCLPVLLVTPLLAIAYSLAYKGNPPVDAHIPAPSVPICKTADCFPPRLKAKVVPLPPMTINAPNGIGISGGHVENPTVNNFAPPQRSLSAEQGNQLKGLATSLPKSVSIMVHAIDDPEAIEFAQQIYRAIAPAKFSQSFLLRPEPIGVFVQVHKGQLGMVV